MLADNTMPCSCQFSSVCPTHKEQSASNLRLLSIRIEILSAKYALKYFALNHKGNICDHVYSDILLSLSSTLITDRRTGRKEPQIWQDNYHQSTLMYWSARTALYQWMNHWRRSTKNWACHTPSSMASWLSLPRPRHVPGEVKIFNCIHLCTN